MEAARAAMWGVVIVNAELFGRWDLIWRPGSGNRDQPYQIRPQPQVDSVFKQSHQYQILHSIDP